MTFLLINLPSVLFIVLIAYKVTILIKTVLLVRPFDPALHHFDPLPPSSRLLLLLGSPLRPWHPPEVQGPPAL